MAALRTAIEDRKSRWQISLLLDEQAVSGLGVVKKHMQIDSAVVKMGGIAGVWTDSNHRRKGYASQAMWESIALMERQNCDMSILFGIDDFYHRYGYAVVFANQSMWLKTSQLLSLNGPLKARRGRRADHEAMRRLYRNYNAARSGMDARQKNWKPRWYMPNLGKDTVRRAGKFLVVYDARDRVRGYAVYDIQAERTVVTEVCGKDREALASVGKTIARRAKRAGAEEVLFHLPCDDPFISLCIPLGCTCLIAYPFNQSAMGRIIHLNRLMKKLLPVFQKRWAHSELNWTGEFAIDTDIGRVGFEISGSDIVMTDVGGRARVSMSQMALTQLVMGYRQVVDIAYNDGIKISRQLLPVLDILFPKGNPYMWWTDRF